MGLERAHIPLNPQETGGRMLDGEKLSSILADFRARRDGAKELSREGKPHESFEESLAAVFRDHRVISADQRKTAQDYIYDELGKPFTSTNPAEQRSNPESDLPPLPPDLPDGPVIGIPPDSLLNKNRTGHAGKKNKPEAEQKRVVKEKKGTGEDNNKSDPHPLGWIGRYHNN